MRDVLDQFLSGEARIESGGGGEKTDAGADFFGLLDDIVAADERGAVRGLEDGGEHAEGGGFAGAIGSEEAVNSARLAREADVIDSADFAAFFVLEAFGQATSFNHQETPWRVFLEQGTEHSQSTTREGDEMLLQREREDGNGGRKQRIVQEEKAKIVSRTRQSSYSTGMDQPLWQLGHCLASNLSGETRNILLHWMQTRWITELTTASDRDDLTEPVGWELGIFSTFV